MASLESRLSEKLAARDFKAVAALAAELDSQSEEVEASSPAPVKKVEASPPVPVETRRPFRARDAEGKPINQPMSIECDEHGSPMRAHTVDGATLEFVQKRGVMESILGAWIDIVGGHTEMHIDESGPTC
jgi:hypothetical protein